MRLGGCYMLNYSTLQTLIQLVRMVADIGILWILLYYTIKIVRNNTRTAQIFKGIILILIIRAIANYFGFKAVDWLAGVLVTYGFLAIIIIFQPEIRTILERLGKNTFFSRLSTLSGTERERLVEELVSATMNLSTNRVGALITIEQGVSLNDFIKTGTPINSLVNAELLNTIFLPNTPIHDGAVIIQGDRIACASAYFPPTNMVVPTRFGARHRAAIGISEITDSITIVVSEKSGRVSIAEEGKLVPVNQGELRNFLQKIILHGEEEVSAESSKVIIPVAPELPSPEVVQEENGLEKRGFFKQLFSANPNIKPNQAVIEADEKALLVEKAKKEAEQLAKAKLEEEKLKAIDDAKKIAKEKAEKEAEAKAQAELEEKLRIEKEAEARAQTELEDRLKAEKKAQEEKEAQDLELALAKEKAETEAKLKAQTELEEKQVKAVEETVNDHILNIKTKGLKPSFFQRLFGKKIEDSVKIDEVLEDKIIEETIPVKKKRQTSSTTTKKTSTSSTPRKRSPKKTSEESENIKPIKTTPHISLEYSVSDESLLDDADFSDDSKGGE